MRRFMIDFSKRENRSMKFIRFLGVLWLLFPCVSFAATSSDFQNASQLLSAARRGDTQTVQVLINRGVDVNYVDSTGMSLVCTAVMNNDRRAIQVLQMYGADASNCDRQIKNYQQKKRVAANGEEYGFFSGLSSSHVILLSAVGVAAVIGGVALLTDAFKAKNNNEASQSGGSHSGGGGGGSSGGSGTQWDIGATPYGPAYLNPNFNIDTALVDFIDAETADFNYLRLGTANNFISDGLNKDFQNYLLIMHGYHPIVSGYLGQDTLRNSSYAPVTATLKVNDIPLQGQPARIALITGNGINPAGSADSARGIRYVVGQDDTQSVLVDKYFNNTHDGEGNIVETKTAFDLSGSGSAFNPFANVNDSALAKIVAGWESDERSYGDLYGFVPNAQLAILRTGNGKVWKETTTQTNVATLDSDDTTLSVGDVITFNDTDYEYKIYNALDPATVTPTVTVNGKTYKLASNSKMFVAKCVSSGCASGSNIAIYVGTDGYWYVNSTGGYDIDTVYAVDENKNIYIKKTQSSSAFTNFQALNLAVNSNVIPALDVVAMTNVLQSSYDVYYPTVENFGISVKNSSGSAAQVYQAAINNYYDYGNAKSVQGSSANLAFSGMNQATSTASTPMIVMPAGDFLAQASTASIGINDPFSATFENYAPLIYSGTLNHNFMTVVAVNNSGGTSSATSVAGYGDGTSTGKIKLSVWQDSTGNYYMSRKCGLTGVGGSGVDPWCFAAAGPTAEMATASAAGAVASVKSAFSYMTNDQVFTLLALTADGPFLKTTTKGETLSTQSLAKYLDSMYDLPIATSFENWTLEESEEYLNAFKDVYGYGLINLERAITPGFAVYYYSKGNIVSSSGNAFWRNATSTTSSARASTVMNGRGTIRTSFYDVIESSDGSISLPRVWNSEISLSNDSRHGLYMGDVLADFAVDSTNKHTNKIGNMTFDMAMSPRAYIDSFNGLDNLRVAFSNEKYDLDAGYQHYLTDGESRFNGRANGVLSLVSNSVTSGAKYKSGNFAFGAHVFSGAMTDENLLEKDPVVSSQFEPGRLGLANGGAMDVAYNNDKFGLNVSFGNMHESNTVLGSISDGLLSLNGADTQYVDAVANYKPFEKVNLSARATFANTHANIGDGVISELSDIKSNAFALGADLYGFSFTAAMPLATVDGRIGYDYADLSVVENNGSYSVAVNNPHVEYIDLAAQKRELRFSGSYKRPLGEFTDAGVGFIYRVNPGNTDAFGNESIMMFKVHHRLGI